MHGQFYSHQQYLQRAGVPQNASSGVSNRASDTSQQPRLRFPSQHAGVINGQTYQARGTEQPQQQQRVQQMRHPAEQLTHQQYAQLLQNQSYQQALYSQALHQQNQTLQASRQQEQQRLLQQQQNAANDQSASLRALLANQYPRDALNQMHQHMANQLGLGQTSVSPHQMATNLQHQQTAAKASSIPHYQDELRNFSRILELEQQRQRSLQDEAAIRTHSQRMQHPLRNIQPAQSSTSQAVLTQRQDLLNLARHISPVTPARSPSQGYPQNPNLYSNVQGSAGLISSHRNAFSPALEHLAIMGASRVPTTPVQIASRTDVSAAQVQDHPIQGTYGAMQNQIVSQELRSPSRILAETPSDSKTIVHVKRQTPSVNSCSAPVIIVDSDDDVEEEEQQPSTSRKSIKSGWKEQALVPVDFRRVVIDDDLEITGATEAEIMSHMRPDCPIHPFHRVDNVNIGPQAQNGLKCGKCYCYVCDKLANQCEEWSTPDKPHCNAHSRASCWKARRNTKRSPLMMKLSADEITPEMAEAGELAMQYMIQIREVYITYRNGIPCEYEKVPCNCQCHRAAIGVQEPCISCKVVHDVKKRFNYQPVREIALMIIAEIQSTYSRSYPVMALIMLEAVLSELCSQRPADFNHQLRVQSNPDQRCQCDFPKIVEDHIEKELVDIFTRHEVKASFRIHFIRCVEEAIKPLQLKDVMKKFLNMRHWDNLLLRAVLTGSNISGSKGREILRETADAVKMRVEKLEKDKRYQSILRYLKTVKILQSQKSTISNSQIMVLMDQWMLTFNAKQGHFKDVVLRLTEPVTSDQNVRVTALALSTFQPEFLIQLLDALAGKDAQPTTRLGSFDPGSSHRSYIIDGKDADVLLLLFHYIVQQNQFATAHIPLYIWLAKWVNRNPLSPCLDPNSIKPWTDQGTAIMETAMRAFYRGQCQSFLLQCVVHDPHVHLFNASINIVNIVSKFQNAFTPEHLDSIMDAYKNNEWGLFLLLTQSPMMNLRNVNVLRWITKFCETNNGSLAQIKDRVIIESIQPYRLEDVSEFLRSLIKPDWVNSIESIQRTALAVTSEYSLRPDWMNSVESIQRTALAVTSEYSLRLLEEMKRCDLKVLAPKAKWLEDVVLKYVEEQRISANLLREEVIANYVKNVTKICSYLNATKRNIELYRKISPSAEWVRRCSTLIQFLAEKFTKERLSGTMEEFSTLLWLLWMIGDLEQMGSYFILFQERHSCSTDGSKITSSKVTGEIASLLDSSPNPETLDNKRSMVERCRRLCVLETLSWLTCTDCATKMSSGWTKIWISIAKSKLDDCVRLLNHAMMEQFKMWLNKISVDSPDNYKRLLGCLRSFLNTLISTWHECSITYEAAGRLMNDVAGGVVHPKLRSDVASISNGIIQAELDKLKPKTSEVPPVSERRPPNHLGTRRPSNNLPASITPSTSNSLPHHKPQHNTPAPAVATTCLNHREKVPPHGVTREPERTRKTSEKEGTKRSEPTGQRHPTGQHHNEIPTKPHAVMSTDSLFKKKSQNSSANSPKPGPEKRDLTPNSPQKDQTPFSSVNLTRTKKCQNCGATISCASFRCPKCNQATRSVQPVTCPECRQENRELKGYSCQYCYHSLLGVLFGGGERPRAASDEVKEKPPQPKKKKSAEKRKKKAKLAAKNNMAATTATESFEIETQKSASEPKTDEAKRLSPLMVKISNKKPTNLSEDSTDSSLDDFVMKKVPQKHKRHGTSSAKVAPIKLKRKPSNPLSQARQSAHGASLTDSDSDAEDKTALIISPDESSDSNKKSSENMKYSPARPKPDQVFHKQMTNSPQRTPLEKVEPAMSKEVILQQQHPISLNKLRVVSPENVSAPKSVNSTHNATPITHNAVPPTHNSVPASHNAPVKRGVGHSSVMSKKQKNILSRLKRPGKGAPKFSTPTKTSPVISRPTNKDLMKSPSAGSQKRSPLDNGPMSSPGRNQMNERQRHDSSCSSGSVGSSSGLSFGLAKVGEKRRARNVGHRTGGAPGSGKKMKLDRKASHSNTPQTSNADNVRRTLLPQPLNHSESVGKKNKKKEKGLSIKMPPISTKRALEQRLNSILARRKPGPASRSNYRKISKIEHKLKKLQRPHRRWRLPPTVNLPAKADLTRYAYVSLCLFPRDKLHRIQKLVPCHRLKVLYA